MGLVLRLIIGIPLALLLPGLALTLALFPRRRVRLAVRVLFSLGLSLCVAALGGLLLNLTPWGLRPAPWAGLLAGATLAATLLAYWRGRNIRVVQFKRGERQLRPVQTSGILLIGAAVVLTGLAVQMARTGAAQQQASSTFTELWLLPQAAGNQLQVGVRNNERTAVTYKLQIDQGGSILREWPSIELDPGKVWESSLAAPAGSASMTANLYRLDTPSTVYRHVTWSPGAAGA